MATTVASIALQLVILGTVVQLSYEFQCTQSFRHADHTKGQPYPPGFGEIFALHKWKNFDLKNYVDLGDNHCREGDVDGCTTVTCTRADGSELFRINGCQGRWGYCIDHEGNTFETLCKPPNKYSCDRSCTEDGNCRKCRGLHCNNKIELVQPPQPKKTTLTIHIESMPISGAMTTSAIGSASAKLIIAIIGNAVLLLTMRGHHNGGKKGCHEKHGNYANSVRGWPLT
ncbi:hypothetical protein niasHT_021303 [Heterodera trifolii]|uniref:Uncharacterized protein n=1 Tax=Heterodera trifolii TaxID=157864 RepID=A0ABD2K360_9BILA